MKSFSDLSRDLKKKINDGKQKNNLIYQVLAVALPFSVEKSKIKLREGVLSIRVSGGEKEYIMKKTASIITFFKKEGIDIKKIQ